VVAEAPDIGVITSHRLKDHVVADLCKRRAVPGTMERGRLESPILDLKQKIASTSPRACAIAHSFESNDVLLAP
jgi:hypothetical protein